MAHLPTDGHVAAMDRELCIVIVTLKLNNRTNFGIYSIC